MSLRLLSGTAEAVTTDHPTGVFGVAGSTGPEPGSRFRVDRVAAVADGSCGSEGSPPGFGPAAGFQREYRYRQVWAGETEQRPADGRCSRSSRRPPGDSLASTVGADSRWAACRCSNRFRREDSPSRSRHGPGGGPRPPASRRKGDRCRRLPSTRRTALRTLPASGSRGSKYRSPDGTRRMEPCFREAVSWSKPTRHARIRPGKSTTSSPTCDGGIESPSMRSVTDGKQDGGHLRPGCVFGKRPLQFNLTGGG